ncbi:MAG TPA: asparaginase [Rhodocyclaceae bacterium]|nr:asparaginase [Rhodocyclaceae bacterium]
MERKLPGHVPLVVATRGDAVESVYYGSIAVVDGNGRRLCAAGDADFPMFTRSALKPFQALPFVTSGGPARFGFSEEQVALLCASHSGEPRHVAAVADMLAKIGCEPRQLKCGCHVPAFYAATGVPVPPDLKLTPLQHNCSGKHAGFLAWCRQHGEPLENYTDPAHPLQRAIRHTLAEAVGWGEDAMPMGIDGCSAPNYALPLSRLAYGYARLAGGDSGPYGEAFAILLRAMTSHPEMVAGEGRGDTLLMAAAPGNWVAKGGAEGVQALGVRSRGLGIALKIADGSPRALQMAIASVIGQLGLEPANSPILRQWRDGEIRNYAGLATGRLMPVFELA